MMQEHIPAVTPRCASSPTPPPPSPSPHTHTHAHQHAAHTLLQLGASSDSAALSLPPRRAAALTHYQRDGPVVPVDLQPTGDHLLPVAPAAGLRRRRRRRRLGLVVLPQVIKRPQDPRNGQNRDGVGPYPAHGEPIWRAPEASPAGSGPSSAEGAASPASDGLSRSADRQLLPPLALSPSLPLSSYSAASLLGFAH